MIVAYADPPYIGQAAKHYDAPEVDMGDLIRSLAMSYDGWALSSGATLVEVATLAPLVMEACPDARVGVWAKPFASFKPGVNPAYTFELVWFQPTNRKRARTEPTVRDFVTANITLERGLSGAKPDGFSFWLFDLLGMTPDDELVDVFPGSGAVSRAWSAWCRQTSMLRPIC